LGQGKNAQRWYAVKLTACLLFVNIEKKQKAQSEGASSQKESQNRGGSRERHKYTREGDIR